MKYLIILLLVSVPFTSDAQWQWAKKFGGSDMDRGGARFIDANNNIYMYGSFSYNFFSQTDTLWSTGSDDLYIAKLNPNGDEQWIKSFGGANPQGISEADGIISLDNTGNFFYITGNFFGNLTIDGNTVNSNGSLDIFIAKFDLSGNCIWIKSIVSPGNDDRGSFVVTSTGDMLLTGSVAYAAQLGSFAVPPGSFWARYDANGNCLQAVNKFSGINFHSMKLLGNDIVATGTATNDTVVIDTITIYNSGAMLARLDVDGNVIWAFGPDSINDTYGIFVDVDSLQNIYWIGQFHMIASFNNVSLSCISQDFFLFKFNSNGDYQWVQQSHADGFGGAFGYGIESDNDGNVYLAGNFAGNAQFGSISVTANTMADFFVARYAPNGDCLGLRNFGIATGGYVMEDNAGSVMISGHFIDTIQIGSQSLTSVNSTTPDIFIAKLDEITGLGEQERTTGNQLLIHANPNAGKCNIRVPDDFLNEKNLELRIFDNSGRLLQQQTLEMNDGKIKVNLDAEAKGVYSVILSNKKKSYSGKIVFE